MAFPDDWSGPYRVYINADKIPGSSNISNHPWLLKNDDFPDFIYANTKSDGGDLRVTSDEAGTTEIPVEVVSWDTSAKTSEVWVKATASYNTNTPLYIWYDNSAASMPATNSTYGAQNVWAAHYSLVMHFNQTPSGSAGDVLDSTANANHGQTFGSMTSDDVVAGLFGKAYDLDGSNDYISVPDHTSLDLGTGTVQIIAKAKSGISNTSLIQKGLTPTEAVSNYRIFKDGASLGAIWAKTSGVTVEAYGAALSETDWKIFHTTLDVSTGAMQMIQNGVEVGTATNASVDAGFNSGQTLVIGVQRTFGSFYALAYVDEVRIIKGTKLPVETTLAEYNNMFGTDFWIKDPLYTKEDAVSLPTDNADLAALYTAGEVDDVASNDATRVSQAGTGYLIHQFKHQHTNNTEKITITWDGQTDNDPSTRTVYLQIYNHDSEAWETLDSDNSTAINTDFTLTGTKSTSLSDYYDADNIVSCRVYQQN